MYIAYVSSITILLACEIFRLPVVLLVLKYFADTRPYKRNVMLAPTTTRLPPSHSTKL